jgi:hypothetical protein
MCTSTKMDGGPKGDDPGQAGKAPRLSKSRQATKAVAEATAPPKIKNVTSWRVLTGNAIPTNLKPSPGETVPEPDWMDVMDADLDDDPQTTVPPPMSTSQLAIDQSRNCAACPDATETPIVAYRENSYYDPGWKQTKGADTWAATTAKFLSESKAARDPRVRCYRAAWNLKYMRREDALKILDANMRDDDRVLTEMSAGAAMFDCAGICGEKGKDGGGTALWISSRDLIMGDLVAQRVSWTCKDGEEKTDVWMCDLWPEELMGSAGTRIGYLCNDFYQAGTHPRTRNHLIAAALTEAIRDDAQTGSAIKVQAEKIAQDWHVAIRVVGPARQERVITSILRKGVKITWAGAETDLMISSTARTGSNSNTSAVAFNKLEQEASVQEGRRVHAYRVGAWVASDPQLQARFKSVCEEYGSIVDFGIRPSKDMRAWAWIVYVSVQDAEEALGADALSEKLSVDEFCEGTITVDLSVFKESNAYKKRESITSPVPTIQMAPPSQVSPWSTTKNINDLIIQVMTERAMTAHLESQIVQPVINQVNAVTREQADMIGNKLTSMEDRLQSTLFNLAQSVAGNGCQPQQRYEEETPRKRPARQQQAQSAPQFQQANHTQPRQERPRPRDLYDTAPSQSKQERGPEPDLIPNQDVVRRLRLMPVGEQLYQAMLVERQEEQQKERDECDI